MKLKIEQIKQLAEKKSYAQAAKIAKELSWYKVKDWSALSVAIEVFEAVGSYEDAKDMAILAYNRNLGGKALVYKLTEIMIKCRQFDDAEELYEDYVRMASRDVNRFILNYKLKKAQNASPNELLEILEDYREQEVDEKYMYELAELYNATNHREECIKACDDIILMFQDGEYVDKAISLKKKINAPLTAMQKKLEQKSALKKNDFDKQKEEMFSRQHDIVTNSYDELDEIIMPENDDSDDVVIIPDTESDEFFDEVLAEEASLDGSEAEVDEILKAETTVIPENIDASDADASDTDISDTDTQEKEVSEKAASDNNEDIDMPVHKDKKEGRSMPDALRALIDKAKRQMDEKYDSIIKESEKEELEAERAESMKKMEEREAAMDIEVKVSGNNIYDTQNIQAEIAKNMSTLLEENEDLLVFRPSYEDSENIQENIAGVECSTAGETKAADNDMVDVSADGCEENFTEKNISNEDEQIEGQLNIMDWMETVKEEKYGKQDTREFSRAEIERMLEEKEEKSAAYEELMKRQMLKKNEVKVESEIKADYDAAVQAAKTDLAFRTGKATLKLEEMSEDMKVKAKLEKQARHTEKAVETVTVMPEKTAETAEAIEAISLDTACFDTVSDEVLEEFVKAELAAAEFEDSNEMTDEPQEAEVEQIPEVSLEDFNEEDKKLTGELAKIFRKYIQMPGLEAQLFDYFATLDNEMRMKNSVTGNIIISGNSSSDKTDLARSMVRAINYLYPDNNKKIAKTTGDSINHRGISKAMNRLKGTALIVEGAGIIQPKRMSELMSELTQDTDRMIVILEDSDAEINVLVNFNPDMAKCFNHRIVLKQYTVNELVEMARKFARKRQYEVDDDALLELYLKIDKLHSVTDNIKLEDIKEIINNAIAKSERRVSRKFFGGLRKKRGSNGDMIYLTAADFKE